MCDFRRPNHVLQAFSCVRMNISEVRLREVENSCEGSREPAQCEWIKWSCSRNLRILRGFRPYKAVRTSAEQLWTDMQGIEEFWRLRKNTVNNLGTMIPV